MRTDPTFWILARAGGVTAYALLTAAMLAGLVLKSRPFRGLKPAAVTDTHRFLSLLALVAVALHGLTLTLDHTFRFGLLDLLVPGMAPYRPLWTGIGVLAAELAVAVHVSFALRKRIGARNWRRLHWATYAVFLGATAHGIASGSDSGRAWAVALYVGAIAAVTAATAWRALASPAPRHARAEPARAEAPSRATT